MGDQSLDFHAQASQINKMHTELGGSREQRAGEGLGEVEHLEVGRGGASSLGVGGEGWGAGPSGCGAAICHPRDSCLMPW